MKVRRNSTWSVILLLALGLFAPASALASNWPAWRGPNGNGISDAVNLPASWGLTENLKWKTPLPSWSGSSPVIWGDRVFVISPALEEAGEPEPETAGGGGGRRGRGGGGGREAAVNGPGGQMLLLYCISRADGKELWSKPFDLGNQLRRKGNSSSPSPVTDGKHVWVVSGNGMVAALDMDGNQKWHCDLVKEYGEIGTNFGYNSSPLLVDDKLIFQVVRGSRTSEPAYVLALDAASGDPVWRVERPTDAAGEGLDAYTTPALLEIEGKKQIVVAGGNFVTGHDAGTGKELWRAGGLNPRNNRSYRIVPSPSVVDGMIYAPSRKTPLLALRTGGTGDVTESHRAWQWTGQGAPDVPTPVADGEYFYMIDDGGLVTCLDARKGTIVWGPDDTGLGRVSASPILADGKIYIVGETAETVILQAGGEFKVLARNTLDGDYTLSTPAIAGEEIFIRTATHLYCIGK